MEQIVIHFFYAVTAAFAISMGIAVAYIIQDVTSRAKA